MKNILRAPAASPATAFPHSPSTPPPPEAQRPAATLAVTAGVKRLFTDMGLAVLTEFRLPSGRRVDVAGLTRKGQFVMAEVKSCQADFDADQKWSEYLDFCDVFYFAVDADFPCGRLPIDEGLIKADQFGASIMREGPSRSMASARRKSLTLRFARQAAMRHAAAQ